MDKDFISASDAVCAKCAFSEPENCEKCPVRQTIDYYACKDVICDLAAEYIKKNEPNFYAADIDFDIEIYGNSVNVETIWEDADENKFYLHCGCAEFEGDIDIESLSAKNTLSLAKNFKSHT